MNSQPAPTLKPYPSYKQTGIPWLTSVPNHWSLQRLKKLVRIKTGGRDTIHKREDGNYPFFIRSQTVERIDTWSHDGKAVLTAGDGAVGEIFHYVNGKFDYHQRVYMFHDFTDIEGKFFFHYFKATLRHETSQGTAKSTVDSLRLPMLQNFPVVVPPSSEQAAIVRYLDHADDLINRYISAKERLIALLDEQRQAVIHQAVTRGLDPNVPSKKSGIEWLDDVPQHWQLPELKQVSNILRGKFTHRPRNDPSLYGGIYPFIQTGDVAAANGIIRTHRQTLNQRGLAVSTMFPAGTLVMTISANIGDVAVLNFEACFPDSIVGFVPTNKVERDFLYYLFRAMKSEFLREAPVNTQGNLNVERIGSKKIPLPSVDEQVTIVRYLAEVTAHIDAGIELAHRQVSLIGEYRTRLIADIVTGQIDVRHAAVELHV